MRLFLHRWFVIFCARLTTCRGLGKPFDLSRNSRCSRSATWQGMNTLEPRVLMSSTLMPLDGTLDNQVETAVVAELDTTSGISQQEVFSTDSRAIWVWREIVDLVNDREERAATLDFLDAKGIDTLYLYAERELQSNQHPLQDQPDAYAELIADIHERGMYAFALLDSPSIAPFQLVHDYNTAPDRQANDRFDGINWDYEPWTGWTDQLSDFSAFVEDSVEYLELGSQIMQLTAGTSFHVGSSLPFFWDRLELQDGFHPGTSIPRIVNVDLDVEWNGVTKIMHQHVQDVFDYITIQAYRDYATVNPDNPFRTDGIISISLDEISYGDAINKPVVLGVETTPESPESITFFEEGESAPFGMESQLKIVSSVFADRPSFSGFAIQELAGYQDWADPLPPSPKLAQGTVTNVGGDWVRVDLADSYDSMVVVVTPNYDRHDTPGVARVRNAQGSHFEVRIDSTEPGTTITGGVTINYVVVEEGVYNQAEHGIKMEAVRFNSTVTDYGSPRFSDTSWEGQQRIYRQAYVDPVVFGQVMTANDTDWSVFWSRGVHQALPPSPNTIRVGKHVGEDPDRMRVDEIIGYLVIDAGSGNVEGIDYIVGTRDADGVDNDSSLVQAVDVGFIPSAAVINQSGAQSSNGGWAVLIGEDPVTSTELSVKIDEDRETDAERLHLEEQVGYFILGQPALQPNLVHGVVENVGSEWMTVDLAKSYHSMVVVATANYDRTDTPGVVRVQNAQGNRFQLRIDSTEPGKTIVSGVAVHYVVVEEGVYNQAEHGIKMEAVRFNSTVTDYGRSRAMDNSWVGQKRQYHQAYIDPMVFGQVMTANDTEWSVFWSRGTSVARPASPNDLYVGKHVGEDPSRTRIDEVIGYIVVDAGSGSVGDIDYAVGVHRTDGVDNRSSSQKPLELGFIPSTAVLNHAGMRGRNGGWAVLIGDEPVTATELSIKIDEDRESDSERSHLAEQVGYFIFEVIDVISPSITSVVVSSTDWAPAFLGHLTDQGLGDGGYAIPSESDEQSITLPWGNINQIKISFSEDVLVASDDMTLRGVNVVNYETVQFEYNADLFVATWTLSEPIGVDKLRLSLSDQIVDLAGNDIANDSRKDVSGDHLAFRFNVMPGDVNQSERVDIRDFRPLLGRLGRRASQAGYTVFADLDGSARIDFRDWIVFGSNLFRRLPMGEVEVEAPWNGLFLGRQ